jgi:hypothetical protein
VSLVLSVCCLIFSAVPDPFSGVLFRLFDPVSGVISLLSNPVTAVACKSVSIVICTLSNPVSGDMLSYLVFGVISVRCLILFPALSARCLIRFLASSLCAV